MFLKSIITAVFPETESFVWYRQYCELNFMHGTYLLILRLKENHLPMQKFFNNLQSRRLFALIISLLFLRKINLKFSFRPYVQEQSLLVLFGGELKDKI